MAITVDEILKKQIGQLIVQCAIFESELIQLREENAELKKQIVRKPDGKEEK